MCEKAYLIRAFYQYTIDSKNTPLISFFTNTGKYSGDIPSEHIEKDGSIVLNISKQAAKSLTIDDDKIFASVFFGGKDYSFSIEIDAISWLKAKETNKYLYLDEDREYIKAFVINEDEKAKAIEAQKNKRVGMSPEEITEWVRENHAKYTKLLQISDWHINYKVIKQDDPVSVENQKRHYYEGGRSGDCCALYQYKSATIRLFAAQVHNVDQLRRLFVHELAHVATACFELYTKYFGDKVLYLSSEQDVARKIKRDVHELLAIQIEAIVEGKENASIGTYERVSEADEKFRRDCYELGGLHKPVIIVDVDKEKQEAEHDPYKIVEKEKEYDPDFWYKKYRKASDNVEEKKKLQTTESDKEKEADQSKESMAKYDKKIIVPLEMEPAKSKYEREKYHWKEIIMPPYIGSKR